ncbi:hypothetical protein PEC18_07520 [Paucibacter sp. O1-1]|nr:hypothetical protein [Paucibacter sp. O1-1]MDA3825720.1 hypothetical protein [Paucibacter sp. O1-1]
MSAEKNGKRWTGTDVQQLKGLAAGNTPTRLIAHRLQRTPAAVQSKASEVGLSLKPVNQSPYNRRKP